MEVIGPEDLARRWLVRYLDICSEVLADREAARRQNEMQAVETEPRRSQYLANKYNDKTPEIVAWRVQCKAFKKRRAPDRPAVPIEPRYRVDDQQVRQDAELDKVDLSVTEGKIPPSPIERSWRNGRANTRPAASLFLKTPRRIAVLVFLMVAGLIERQVHPVLAEFHQPTAERMPEGRITCTRRWHATHATNLSHLPTTAWCRSKTRKGDQGGILPEWPDAGLWVAGQHRATVGHPRIGNEIPKAQNEQLQKNFSVLQLDVSPQDEMAGRGLVILSLWREDRHLRPAISLLMHEDSIVAEIARIPESPQPAPDL
ncbi:MAG: hypothetical protein ACP5N6_13475 [Anaerolineae bacterium]|uniref:hypothetical protein n=1 Tax=Thermogutta sp. TaxID=1962930 RepID=UPI003220267A